MGATGDGDGNGDGNGGGHERGDGTERVWLVERTYSDDEQNIIILVYATPDGERYLRKERALTSFTGDHRDTYAALDADSDRLAPVDDPERARQYAVEAERMRERHDSGDAV